MEITEKFIKTQTDSEILSDMEEGLKKEYGEHFKIKDGGILERLLKTAVSAESRIQDNIFYFSTQFNPLNAENIWQDALFERLGISRLEESNTIFTLQVKGSKNCKVSKNTILIRTKNSNEEFLNCNDFITDENGIAYVDFIATSAGAVKFKSDDVFKIIRAPSAIKEILDIFPGTISSGRERESDENYKVRYENSKALTSQATARANMSNLDKFVNASDFLRIHDVNTDRDIDHNCVKIIAKHNTTDNIFAQAIFETFGSGVKFLGTTSVILKDDKGENVKIKFYKAEDVPITIKVKIKIEYGQYEENVVSKVKEKLLEFVNTRNYGLGSILYATEFIVPLLTADIGIEAIEQISIKVSDEENFKDIIELAQDEVPLFDINKIFVEKETEDEAN